MDQPTVAHPRSWPGQALEYRGKKRKTRRELFLNQYQGGMCISRVLKTTEWTPQHLISPISPNWVATDSAV